MFWAARWSRCSPSSRRADRRRRMAIVEPSFTFGIEEEYLLVDRDSPRCGGGIPPRHDGSLRRTARRVGRAGIPALPDRGRDAGLPHPRRGAGSRRAAARRAGRGSRPSTAARPSRPRPIRSATGSIRSRPRASAIYQIDEDLQLVARRLLTCGMHVHVRHRGSGDADRPDEPGSLLPAASAGALDFLSVLGRGGDRADVIPAGG